MGVPGLILAFVLSYFLVSSIERRLWTLFSAFMTGAMGSLIGPSYSINLATNIETTGTATEAAGNISSGGGLVVTLLWFAGAVISGIFAYINRGR
ncbi:MAG: hypothetical protein BM559_06465 [Roseobacter sp. MedPE-SWchi]|nr:MAG: hypothetical protein BM559_06465 [Roseobacter sp. MedPE-SWchi]